MARAEQSVSRHVFYITSATAAKVPLPKGVHPHRGNRLQNVTARAERFIYMSGTWARTAPPPHPHPCGRPCSASVVRRSFIISSSRRSTDNSRNDRSTMMEGPADSQTHRHNGRKRPNLWKYAATNATSRQLFILESCFWHR